MKRTIIGVLLTAAVTGALAAKPNWFVVVDQPHNVRSIDLNSIKRVGSNKVSFWVKSEYDDLPELQVAMAHITTACDSPATFTQDALVGTDQNGHSTQDTVSQTKPLTPGSVINEVIDAACKIAKVQ
jgi:hypothetical protein